MFSKKQSKVNKLNSDGYARSHHAVCHRGLHSQYADVIDFYVDHLYLSKICQFMKDCFMSKRLNTSNLYSEEHLRNVLYLSISCSVGLV